MKRRMKLLAVGAALTASTGVWASGPPYDVLVSGAHVLMRAYTDTRWRCTYAVTALFTDGSQNTWRGQTDPVTNAHPVTAADVNFGRPVASATVTLWDCQVIE